MPAGKEAGFLLKADNDPSFDFEKASLRPN